MIVALVGAGREPVSLAIRACGFSDFHSYQVVLLINDVIVFDEL